MLDSSKFNVSEFTLVSERSLQAKDVPKESARIPAPSRDLLLYLATN